MEKPGFLMEVRPFFVVVSRAKVLGSGLGLRGAWTKGLRHKMPVRESRELPGVYRDATSDEGVTPSEFFAQSPRARSTCSTMSRTAPSPPRNSET